MAFVFFPLTLFPMTWVWMLVYGNLGFGFSYWESLPLGIGSVLLLGLFIVLMSNNPKTAPDADPEPAVRPDRRWTNVDSRPDPVRL